MTSTHTTPKLAEFSRKCDELFAEIQSTRRQIALSHAELKGREDGFTGFADSLRVLYVAEKYGLNVADAEAYIEDQQEQDERERHQEYAE